MSRETYVFNGKKFIPKWRDGVLTKEYIRFSGNRTTNPFAGYGSDSLAGGVNGIFNHADGKRYDSKSQYERAVKAKGCRVVGNDFNNAQWKPPSERGIQGDFNVRPQLREAVQKAFT